MQIIERKTTLSTADYDGNLRSYLLDLTVAVEPTGIESTDQVLLNVEVKAFIENLPVNAGVAYKTTVLANRHRVELDVLEYVATYNLYEQAIRKFSENLSRIKKEL